MYWYLFPAACLLFLPLGCAPIQGVTEIRKQTSERKPEALKIRYQYCNLDSSAERRAAIEKSFADAGIAAVRVAAVPGKDLNVDTLLKARLYDKEVFAKNRGREARAGELGYHFSFLNYLVQSALSPDELIVHFDDDAVFAPTLDADLRAVLREVPADWGVLFLGCNRGRIVGAGGHIFGFPGYEPNQGGDFSLCPAESMIQVGTTAWHKLGARCVAGSYAVIVRSRTAQELLPHLLQMTAESDMTLSSRFDTIQAYCADPPLVDVAPVLSTIK
jgi:hypothetical protein